MSKRTPLLQHVKDFLFMIEDEMPSISHRSPSIKHLHEVVKEFEKEELIEMHWKVKQHYSQLRYYPVNFTATQFMKKFMPSRKCLLQKDLDEIKGFFPVRHFCDPVELNKKPKRRML